MLTISLLLAFFAGPFWETVPPANWTDEQLESVLYNSPWAGANTEDLDEMELKTGDKFGHFYLCSAAPLLEAEKEYKRRHPPTGTALEDDYATEHIEFLEANPGQYIMLAVYVRLPQFLADEKEIRSMENKSFLLVGKKKYKMVGHFPPTPGDPYLRLVFPREVTEKDDWFRFDVYVPGVPKPYRKLDFGVKDLYYKGKLEL